MFNPIRRMAGALTLKSITAGTALVLASVGGTYGLRVRDRLKQTNPRHIQSSLNVSESLKSSNTVRNLINPRGHASMGDSHSIILSLDSGKNVSTENVLSAFVNGFFSGPIFLPESIVLSLFSILKVSYEKLIPTADQKIIWSATQLSDSQLPPTSSILWGTFQIAEIELSDNQVSEPIGSRVDIVFGDSRGGFAGCHRFSVQQLETNGGSKGDQTKLRLSLECLVCDPTSSIPKDSKLLHQLHNNYSFLLFRDAVAHTKIRFDGLL
ncbi:hypothetical protein V8C35DRAFT_310293 [Trichoderma chlorosporum]